MSIKKLNKNITGSKPVGIRMPLNLIDAWEKLAKSINQSKAVVVESALYNLLSLPESKQKEIIKNYLTKDL